ncbi:TonB-dependent receptor plug domain-containing protein [Neolewinella persica]|uniref:TonB-dependent receptor plug domain-containing protein n=1 Tax=Neolewinella persica TaxID=70998 RepID=UPI000379DAED|nr:TonB-dependent receptor plug domain-containing protein [Neolewinella persica]
MRLLSLAFCLLLSCCLAAQVEPKSEWEGLTIPPDAPSQQPVILHSHSSLDTGDPLYIINGYPAEKADLQDLNPASIESINVLKGESALVLYGSQGGKNGVIIIQTKDDITPRADYTLTPEEIPADIFSLYETKDFGAGKQVVYLLQGNPIKLRKLKKLATTDIASIKVYERALKVRLMGYSEQEVIVDVILR